MLERQVNHLVRLVDDLLEISRITHGKIELRKERVEVAAIVRTALESSRPLIERSNHRLAVSLPSDIVTLDADPTRIAQVLGNLLTNAAKYTPEGGQILLSARVEGDRVCISIKDNGVGIPPEMLPKVFDMFTQVDKALGRSQGGLGIGLSLVHRLVEMHGGSVEARSDGAGQGSEFIIRLPVVKGDAPRTEHHRPKERREAVANRRILVVDDNRDAADSLSMLLKSHGAEVWTVHDGHAALNVIKSVHPSVVLLDIGMPKMDGNEVARRARRLPGGQDLALIALSGWGQEQDRRRSLEAGFDHHLTKPIDLAVLEEVLSTLPSLRPVPADKK